MKCYVGNASLLKEYDMRILFFCSLWGNEKQAFDDFATQVKAAGYEGVEMSLPTDKDQKNHILSVLKSDGLSLIAQHWETCDANFQTHKSQYEKRLYNLTEAQPLFINSQTGKDFFSFDQNCELIELAKMVSEKTGITILHETHRGKFSFAAHITRRYLEHFNDLRLTMDISHWCNVAESMLQDQEAAVTLAIERTDHIHARVGFEEGPQIPDPRVPEWGEVLNKHLEWWDRIIKQAKLRNREIFTITPEFGPFPYMQKQPFTQMPISDQWQINLFMKELLSNRTMNGS